MFNQLSIRVIIQLQHSQNFFLKIDLSIAHINESLAYPEALQVGQAEPGQLLP